MKKLTTKGKLSLNKETIAKLTDDNLLHVKGAMAAGPTVTTCTACTGGTATNQLGCCYPPCW